MRRLPLAVGGSRWWTGRMADANAVAHAMREIDRRGFLPPRLRGRANEDRPLPIGRGQTNSQPRTVEAMLRLLEPAAGDRVLDVGAGSGWTTALLAHLVGPDGSVIGVELEPDLARWGAANVAAQDLPHASLEVAREGVLGWPWEAPYDRILVSAAARELPGELVDQLGDDGVMVCVVRSKMLRVRRGPAGAPIVTEHGYYSFVPLR
jgi:protein-L-isoaspartate(D-aspartate) O-methyltransferase